MARLQQASSASTFCSARNFTFGNFRLEADGTLLRGDAVLHLSPKELAALQLLLEHHDQIVTYKQLKHALWGDVHVTDDSIAHCISTLRERLEPDECIQTVYKRGYRFSMPDPDSGIRMSGLLPRLAIMPFTVAFKVAPHLGQAIAEETIALLAAERFSPALIVARDSVFTLAATGLTAQQVGQALHADLALTGTLRAMPSHFRLRAEMIRVADGTQLWIEDMLVPQQRVAGLESELASRLLVRLSSGGLTLSSNETRGEQDNDPTRGEAYELLLRGHHEWQTLQRHRMEGGLQQLLHAVELDPSLVSAQIDLANSCVTQSLFGFMEPRVAAQYVRTAAHALPASADGAEAVLPALGWVRFHVDYDLQGALKDFASSAHLPHETSTTRFRSMFALSRHQFEEAIDLLVAALRSDPFSPWLNARLAWAYHLAGEPAKSLEQIEHALDLFPEHEGPNLYGTMILAYQGNPEKAIVLSQNLARSSAYFDVVTAVHGYALACSGRREEAVSAMERLQWLSRERFVMSSFTAALCVALRDFDGAIAQLQAAAKARCPWFFQMLADPRLKPLDQRPEFGKMQQILAHMESSVSEHL